MVAPNRAHVLISQPSYFGHAFPAEITGSAVSTSSGRSISFLDYVLFRHRFFVRASVGHVPAGDNVHHFVSPLTVAGRGGRTLSLDLRSVFIGAKSSLNRLHFEPFRSVFIAKSSESCLRTSRTDGALDHRFVDHLPLLAYLVLDFFVAERHMQTCVDNWPEKNFWRGRDTSLSELLEMKNDRNG